MLGLGMKKSIILCMAAFVLSWMQGQCATAAAIAPSPTSLLHQAVHDGDIQVVTKMLDGDEQVLLFEESEKKSAFHCALTNKGILQLLCKKRPDDINVRNGTDLTPLIVAVARGNKDGVEVLLNANADIAYRIDDVRVFSAVHSAVALNHLEILKLICVQRPSAVDVRNGDGQPVLHFAINKNNINAVEILLDAGADKAIHDHTGATAFHCALDKSSILELLCRQNTSAVDMKDMQGFTPLHRAVMRNNMEATALLLRAGADPSIHDKVGRSAFHATANSQILELLYKAKPGLINILNSRGMTPLDDASKNFIGSVNNDEWHKIGFLLKNGGEFRFQDEGPALLAKLLKTISNKLFQASNEDDLRLRISVLRDLIDNHFKKIVVMLDDNQTVAHGQIDSPYRRNQPVLLSVVNQIVLAQQATITPDSFKRLLADLLKHPVPNKSGSSIALSEYCKILEVEWEASSPPTDNYLQAPSHDEILSVLTKLPAPLVDKVNVTVISLPTLLQTAEVADMLYREGDDVPRPEEDARWKSSCSFYAKFHLVNAWRNRGDAIGMLKDFSRNNFSNFLGLMRSAGDVAKQLSDAEWLAATRKHHQNNIATSGEDFAKKVFHEKKIADLDALIARTKYYPTIKTDLELASQWQLGGLPYDHATALTTSYIFLTGSNESIREESVLQYCPHYADDLESKPLSFFHFSANNEHSGIFTQSDELLRYLQGMTTPLVFPLSLGTKKHASSALVYKFQLPSTDAGMSQPQYIVFFAESNRFSGHEDHAQSDKGEYFNFKTALTRLFAKLELRPESDVHVQGPTDELTVREKAFLVQAMHQKLKEAGGQSFEFEPQDVRMNIVYKAIEADDAEKLAAFCKAHPAEINIKNPYQGSLLQYAVLKKAANAVQVLLNAGADLTVKNALGWTVFHLAAILQSLPILKLLCASDKANATINLIDLQEKTVLDIAERHLPDARDLLVSLGAKHAVELLVRADAHKALPPAADIVPASVVS
jgi:26S proteasome non-ATPase regulatory subunit 10